MIRDEDADDVTQDLEHCGEDKVEEDVSAEDSHAHADAVVHHGNLKMVQSSVKLMCSSVYYSRK